MKAGVAISPDTPSTSISDEVGELADLLLVMTVYPGAGFFPYLLPFLTLRANTPGRGGQKFIERCVPKVAELRARFPDKDIEVDGGVGPKTVDVCAQAGMSYLCFGPVEQGNLLVQEAMS
jgi:ribulose-phosphate 3-epimerase